MSSSEEFAWVWYKQKTDWTEFWNIKQSQNPDITYSPFWNIIPNANYYILKYLVQRTHQRVYNMYLNVTEIIYLIQNTGSAK